MSLQQQIVSLFCQTFKNANVKKVDKDNIDFKEMTTKSSGNYTFINFNFKIIT